MTGKASDYSKALTKGAAWIVLIGITVCGLFFTVLANHFSLSVAVPGLVCGCAAALSWRFFNRDTYKDWSPYVAACIGCLSGKLFMVLHPFAWDSSIYSSGNGIADALTSATFFFGLELLFGLVTIPLAMIALGIFSYVFKTYYKI